MNHLLNKRKILINYYRINYYRINKDQINNYRINKDQINKDQINNCRIKYNQIMAKVQCSDCKGLYGMKGIA